jgi:hypothetical protein
METTRPLLYIDLEKSTWREDLHKRDNHGRFATVKTGSKIVTKNGKTGTVTKVGDEHYHYRDDATGKVTKVQRGNAIHATDHKKIAEAQAKTKKRKASAAKGTKTKATNKANGHGKAQVIEEPKAKTAVAKKTAKKTAAAKDSVKAGAGGVIRKKDLKATTSEAKKTTKAASKKVTGSGKNVAETVKKQAVKTSEAKKQKVKDMSPNSKDTLKTQEIAVKNAGKKVGNPENDKQTQALAQYANMEKDRDTTKDIDNMWKDRAVQKLMQRAPEKRSEADIRRLAGQITTSNDKLARHVTLQMGKARGLNLLMQQNKIGDVGQSGNGEVINQETGYYGDLLQAARSSMYETLYRIMKGSQNPKEGSSIGAHVVSRMKQKLHSNIYDLMNEIPAPHEIRSAIGDMEKAKRTLQQSLGRNPEEKEIAEHLQSTSNHFKNAPIMEHPNYDEKSGQWVATKKRIEDPVERLRALRTYAEQQKASSIDDNIGSEGEKEITAADNIKDDALTPEEAYERKERQAELKDAIPKALEDLGLNDKEKLVFMTMFGSPSAKTKKANLTQDEVADAINEAGGYDDGKQATQTWVNKYYRSAMEKLMQARQNNHPALQDLQSKFMKSLFFNLVFKAMYEYDLVKSMTGWGIGFDALTMSYTRTAEARSLLGLQKSLQPYEYVGSLVTTEDGGIHARIVEFSLPDDNALYKSFTASMDSLKKSMFPHKGKSNHDVNQKAADYVKANKQKYSTLSEAQHSAAKAKGNNTWSEELLLKHPGSAWITWGGKRVLIDVGDGKIIYDSKNDAHREEHNNGASEDKVEFHHEKDELAKNEGEREKQTRAEWDAHVALKKRTQKKKGVDYKKEQEDFSKKHKGVSFDEEGNLLFQGDQDIDDTNRHSIDHGVQAFKEQMAEMQKEWNGKSDLKNKVKDISEHKTNHAYTNLTDEQREEVNNADDKAYMLGKHMMAQHGEALTEAISKLREDGDTAAFADTMKALAGKNKSNGMATWDDMKALGGKITKLPDADSEESKAFIARALGEREIAAGRRAAGKKMLPEGAMLVGNPLTGKVMVVKIEHGFGEGSKASWTSKIAEAFDPDGGQHEELTSWGGLARALGMKNNGLQETLAQHANESETQPFMKQIDDEEYARLRSNTKLGLQEGMAHKDFRLVKENRDKETGELHNRIFAMDMPDGTQNTIMTDKDGYITDPVMARLIKQDEPIENADDLHRVLKNAVGNRAWVTAHFGNDIHVGDALGHHVQLEYDGKGAPRVVGGAYDGYRFMDSNDIPKDAVDPATGEPIKALFKNGRLVDRRFTTKNAVDMKAGNPVMYKDGDKYRKGRIHSIEGNTYKITDGKGHVVGMFKKGDLKAVMADGKTNSQSGQAVVRLAKNGTHRMNTEGVFSTLNPKDQKKVDKAKELFKQALQKAGVHKAFDKEGNLQKNLELSDANMRELKKRLGRSKAGKELLSQFKSAYTKELELHVPDSLRAKVEAEGVTVGANGTARISAGKFEQLRDVLGGLSIDNNARKHLEDHFKRKDRTPMNKRMPEIIKNFQPAAVDQNSEFGKAYRAQFKSDSFLMDKNKGLYDVQLQGVAHLIERGRGIVGHGMGVGKTIEGVTAAMHYKASKLANGETPKKTLIVSPAGIQSDWGKEIGGHTNSKALYIGSEAKMKKKDANGNYMKAENGRHMFGQDGTEQEAVSSKHFLKNMDKIGSEDHDFHIMSYDQFMKMRHELANSGLYDNIIIDEVHAFKNQRGQRGKSLAETTDAFKNVWGLSGTPMENDAREVYSLVDTITGGRHELGSPKEFADTYLQKDKNGKIIGVKENKSKQLGDILANVVQFRNGSDVKFTSGKTVEFPQIVGQTSEANPNPQTDFIGDMVDRSRDHQTTDYYGTKHSVFDYTDGNHDVTAKDGSTYNVKTTEPTNLTPDQQDFYNAYKELQSKHLPDAKLKELVRAAATGYDSGSVGKKNDKNYLTAMQKLQKFLNGGKHIQDMYVPGGSALDSELTGEQSVAKGKKKAEGLKPYNPLTGEGHYQIDSNGHKRYFKSDGKGGFERDNEGNPVLLPPLHHNNPKAQYLKQRVSTYLDALANENSRRREAGQPELMPKVVVKSSYTTFGTDIVDSVLRDLQNEHPHLNYWANKLASEGKELGSGQFTGEADDRETTKTGFRGDKKDYANNQGNLWATTVSPAGKEGVDFGNAHLMLMYDQDWNPQRMAQFTARVRRSDSAEKAHNQVGRANAVRVESLHMPGTIEDFMFNAEDTKMGAIKQVTQSTREKELSPKFGDSEARVSSSKNFTRSSKNKLGAKAKDSNIVGKVKDIKKPNKLPDSRQEAAATTEKAMKLVIIL